ncbi:MAG: 50S ribosomal protein L17 [Ignavibacteria bacterium RBG_16_34_14]|nr:MAG: 50S ribosomal protein L17 [Ignavibacteria bacterium RBG_16_34_14]
MRHRVRGRKLSRTGSHRKALLKALASSLFKHKRIRTTLAKAKEARSFAETLITKARRNSLHSKRQVISALQDKSAANELFGDILQKVGDRPGGYTRVVKLGSRKGDAADMAILELVDYNEVMKAKEEEKKEKKEVKKAKKKEKEKEEAPEVEEAKVVEEAAAEEKPKKKQRKKKKDEESSKKKEEDAKEKSKKKGRKKKEE